jgi:small subunit ribosomal protein S19
LPRQFSYRGHNAEELQQMSMDEFIRILPSRQRRSLTRGLTADQRALMELIRVSRRNQGNIIKAIKTHCRDMIIIPEMIGLSLLVHSGKEFTAVDIKPEMIGHYLGEFVITNKKVVHGTPGIGASRSSMYVPLK